MTNPNISLEPRAAKLTKSGRVNTPKGRLAFVTVMEARLGKLAKPGDKPKFSACILLPKGADLTALKTLINDEAKKSFGSRLENPKFKAKLGLPLKKAAEQTDKDGNPYTGFDDPRFEYCFWATSTIKPGVVNALGKSIDDTTEAYSGRWGLLNVHAYSYGTKSDSTNWGVSLGLDNVQFLDHDDGFSGRGKASDEFEAVAGAEGGGGDSDSVFDE